MHGSARPGGRHGRRVGSNARVHSGCGKCAWRVRRRVVGAVTTGIGDTSPQWVWEGCVAGAPAGGGGVTTGIGRTGPQWVWEVCTAGAPAGGGGGHDGDRSHGSTVGVGSVHGGAPGGWWGRLPRGIGHPRGSSVGVGSPCVAGRRRAGGGGGRGYDGDRPARVHSGCGKRAWRGAGGWWGRLRRGSAARSPQWVWGSVRGGAPAGGGRRLRRGSGRTSPQWVWEACVAGRRRVVGAVTTGIGRTSPQWVWEACVAGAPAGGGGGHDGDRSHGSTVGVGSVRGGWSAGLGWFGVQIDTWVSSTSRLSPVGGRGGIR